MIATDTAQIVLMDGSLNKLEELFDIAGDLEANMKNNLYISTVPSAICLGGIAFFHWGVLTGITITLSTLFVGITNSILPLLRQQRANGGTHKPRLTGTQ